MSVGIDDRTKYVQGLHMSLCTCVCVCGYVREFAKVL